MEGSEAWYAIVLVVPQRKAAALVERVVGHLNNEKAAPPSLLEQSCGQGMHGRYLNQTSSNISCVSKIYQMFLL